MKVLAISREADEDKSPVIFDNGQNVGILDESGVYVSVPKALFTRAAAALIAEASLE